MLKKIVLVFTFLLFLSACGGGGSKGSVDSSIKEDTVLKSNAVIIGNNDSSKVTGKTLLDNDSVNVEISDSSSFQSRLIVGNKLHILAGENDNFPLGISGSIDEVVNSNGKSSVTISPLKFADIANESVSISPSINISGDNLIAVISPNAVRDSSARNVNSLQGRSLNSGSVITKSFLNGAVTVVKDSNISARSFLNESGVITPDSIKLNFPPILLKDMVDDPSKLNRVSESAETKLLLEGEISNLRLVENHEFGVTSPGLNSLEVSVSGDIEASVTLDGGVDFTAGYYSKAWNEVAKDQFDKLGQSGKISGLDSKDKIGKYPLAGLVFSIDCPIASGCPVATGSTQTPLRTAKKGGVIVWVYMTANGKLSFSTQLGVKSKLKFKIGAEKKTGGKFTNTSSLSNPDNGRVLEAPFFNGKVNLQADLGVSIDADFFMLGVRPLNFGLDVIGRFTGGLNTTDEMNYGFTKFGDDWSWQGGEVCMESSIGGGAILSSAFDFGYDIDVDVGFYQDSFDGNPNSSGQWPTDDDIKEPGWHGLGDLTWYSGQIYNKCFPSLSGPNLSVTPKDKSVLLEWIEKDSTTYDLCYSTKSISDPIKCAENGGVKRIGVDPNYLLDNLTNGVLYYFSIIANYKYTVIENERVEMLVSNEVSATPFDGTVEALLTIPDEIAVTEGEYKEAVYTWTNPNNSNIKPICLAEQGIQVQVISDSKFSFTAPTLASDVDSLQFKLSCTVFYDIDKSVSDEALVTVTKDLVIVDPNPVVTLPADATYLLDNDKEKTIKVVPIEIAGFDTDNIEYTWLITWTGNEGFTGSTSGSTLDLTLPALQVDEAGSVKVTLRVSDGNNLKSDSVTYDYSVTRDEAIFFDGDDFDDNSTLERGSSQTLTWKYTNKGNVDLKEVVLKLSSTVADKLTVSEISPSTITDWPVGVQKTFTVTVDVPKTVKQGIHEQWWNFYHGSNQALPLVGKAAAAPLFFKFNTEGPSDLVGRFILEKKLLEPGQSVKGLMEVTSGNSPYSLTIDWGDGTAEDTYTNLLETNLEGAMTKSVSHTYTQNGNYSLKVKVTDGANKVANYIDVIKVSSDGDSTDWQVDIHDITSNEFVSNDPFTVTAKQSSAGTTYQEYSTDWDPGLDPTSKEYFVKYRLPVPSGLLTLDKKMRFTVRSTASEIVAYDREINLRTSNNKEYTASVRETGHQDTLPDGTPITGGYFTTKNLADGDIVKQAAPSLNDTAGSQGLFSTYALETNPDTSLLEVTNTVATLFTKNITLGSNWVTELDITFKGNGKIQEAFIEYDVDGDGEFSVNEKLVLNTQDKTVDWSQLGITGELKPDLIISLDSYTNIGDLLAFNYTIKNIGTGVAYPPSGSDEFFNKFSVSLLLSSDSQFDDSNQIGSQFFNGVTELAPGETISAGVTFSKIHHNLDLINTPYFTIFVDYSGEIDELDETNNSITQLIDDQTYDTQLLACINESLGLLASAVPTQVQIESITSLDCSDKGITDISALSQFTNLEGLDLSYNTIADISAISRLTKLTYLALNGNKISNINSISSLSSLRQLSLFNNEISDIFALSNLVLLENIRLNGNKIENLNPLNSLVNLTNLDLNGNSIIDISSIEGLINIEYLFIDRNLISDISVLSNFLNLRLLTMNNNTISDLTPLSSLINLSNLEFGWNNVSDISPLSNFMGSMFVEGNCISDFSSISSVGTLITGIDGQQQSCTPIQ